MGGAGLAREGANGGVRRGQESLAPREESLALRDESLALAWPRKLGPEGGELGSEAA